ncbi:MAG: glycoside hydrolase family 15 protein [Thermoplasmata archaeon]
MRFRGDRLAFGAPGIEPKWTQGNKEGVGTSPSAESKVWFTLWRGVVTEVYYPLIDHPQIRDLQFLVSDGRTFFHEEKRHLVSQTERMSKNGLGYRITAADPAGRYRLEKEVISDPRLPVVLMRTHLIRSPSGPRDLSLYALLAPHLDVGGWGNNAYVVELAGRQLLVAERHGTWLALGATLPFRRLSCGYVGQSDGWTDVADNFRMDYEFDHAPDGNVALTGEIDLEGGDEFTLGLAFGQGLSDAVTALLQSLGLPFSTHRDRYLDGWDRLAHRLRPLDKHSGDGGNLYHASHSLLLAHEDKTFRGARIASLSIPWGQAKSDEDRGGYHLVWSRDLVQSAIGLLASGDPISALGSLIYLGSSQRPDGNFPQNFWLSGEPYWAGVQLDEVAFPILLAGLLRRERALQDYDPWPMVRSAAQFLLTYGPATEQERWEEESGYSPSTLASNVAAVIVAASFARAAGESETAHFLEEYADYLNDHIEGWTVTTVGTLHPQIRRHYVRIRPADPMASYVEGPANGGTVRIPNHPEGDPATYPAHEIVDAGFLALVRYGLRRADDPLIVDSLRVVDHVLRVTTPYGPCWRRYNHDGYGQRDDGGPFLSWGTGRAWPLLTAERAHYELAHGTDVSPLVRAVEAFASSTGLLPEQVWDASDLPELHLELGRATTSAMPLVWAHAEYLTLLRSVHEGAPFDRVTEVEARYSRVSPRGPRLEVWKPHHRPTHVAAGTVLRIQAPEPFRLHWSEDAWSTVADAEAAPTTLGIHYFDLPTEHRAGREIAFTLFWPSRESWEGRNYSVRVDAAP